MQHYSPPSASRLPTILVVENDAVVRLLAVAFLEDSGFAVVDAGNAAGAIEVLNGEDAIDAVVSGVRMGGAMDGLGLACWISREKPEIKVLLTSGTEPDRPGRPVLVKPYEMAALARRLKDMVEH